MRKKRRIVKDRRKFLSWMLIVLVLLLALTLYFLFGQLKEVELEGELKNIGVVSVDDDVNTTSIIDVSINDGVSKGVNFTRLSIKNGIPYNRLIFYLPFDEDDDTNTTYDYAGVNNGEVNGGPSFVDCIYSMCYDFDGDNDFIEFSDEDFFDFGTSAFTISFWIKGNGSNGGIITKDNFDTQDNGIMIFTDVNGNYSYNNGSSVFSIGGNDSRWHYVAVTRETIANSRVTLYFDGEFVRNFTDERDLDNSKDFIIGADFGGSVFGGMMDEIMIFNASLDPAEISNIYGNQSSRYESEGTMTLRHFNMLDNIGNNVVDITTDDFEILFDSSLELRVGYWDVSDGYTDDSGDSVNSGLIGYWHADGNVNDASGNDHNGVEEGGLVYGEGVWGESFSLDGDDAYVNISSVEGDFNAQNGTISFWVHPSMVSSGDRYFSHSGENIYFQNGNNNGITFAITNVGAASGTLTLDRWNHVVGTYNMSGSKIYVDGIEVGSGIGSPDVTLGNEFYLGLDTGDSARFAPGRLDEIMIFDRPLDLDEIEELYVKGRANYEFSDYEVVDGDNEFTITDETTSLLPEYKFVASAGQFYTPLLFTGIHFDYSVDNSVVDNDSFVDNGIVDIIFPFNGSNTNNKYLDVNYTVDYVNVSTCWYSNDTFNVNITLTGCENITDVVWRRGFHEVRVYANSTNGNESASRVFFRVLSNDSNFVDRTGDTDFNQTDPIATSNPTVVVDTETIQLTGDSESDPSLIVYWLIIGILLILIFIVIFLLIKSRSARHKSRMAR